MDTFDWLTEGRSGAIWFWALSIGMGLIVGRVVAGVFVR